MVDEAKELEKQEIQPIILTITFNPANGAVSVSGPIHDRVLCYGILGMARDAIFENATKKPAIVPVTGMKNGMLGFLRNGHK